MLILAPDLSERGKLLSLEVWLVIASAT